MEYTIMPIDHAIKLAITASIKRVEFKRYNVDPDEIVDALLTDIFTDLFPHNPSLVTPNSNPIVRLPVVQPDENVAPAPAKRKYTKKSTTTTTETPAENPVVIESTTKPEPKKRGPKKVQTDTPQHIKNFNPTQMKKIKEAGAEEKVNDFKDYLNSLTEEGFKSKKIPDHLQDFLNPKEEESLAELPGCIDVDYEIDGEMKPYAVNPATKCVYEKQGEVYVKVGMVGALQFAEMEI